MNHTLLDLTGKLQHQKVMVIGDLVADVYLEGKISRISREAPVLILEHAGETVVPGGAANAVYNAVSLGGEVYAVGVVGDDSAGSELIQILRRKMIRVDGIVLDNQRPTITKTRVMAGGYATVRQQIVRIDREDKTPVGGMTETMIREYIINTIKDVAIVILSDYGSGTLSPAIMQTAIAACRENDIPCLVDSRYNIMAYKGVTVVKQNESEAAAALGYKALDQNTLPAAGQTILNELQAEAVLITQGPDGMTLFEDNGRVTHIPVTNKSEVYDVTGAGDTVVVTMALAIAAGAGYPDAARLANFAAGIVVRKPGTATTTCAELKEAIGCHEHENDQ